MIQATLITEGLKIVKSSKSTNGKENRTQNIVNRHRDGKENGTQNRHRDRGTDKKEKCQEMVQDLIDNKVSIYT